MNILLADDQSRVRFALRILLEQQTEWKVIGEAIDANELLTQAESHHPDLILLDGDLPGLIEFDCLPTLRRIHPHICIIGLSEQQPRQPANPDMYFDACSSKANPPEYLLKVIRICLDKRQQDAKLS